ncbi:MAG: ArnT family glycosyltransferase [Candidatus Levyibacteriota bacterium]
MDYIKTKVVKHRSLLALLFVYFSFTVFNLTALPIYNDESIYLDWSWSEIHIPGNLFMSLTDAKQPLLMWLFGISEKFFSDPLFAGRFVSVIIGATALVGVYVVSKKLCNSRVAFLASLLYIITPIFVFYNRQALMESSIASVGIWSFYFLLRLLNKPTYKTAVILGIIFGLGFFTKSSGLLFIAPALFLIITTLIKNKSVLLFKSLFILALSFFITDFLLFIEPIFWQTFSTNSRYSLTVPEMVRFPVFLWLHNFSAAFQIGFVFITPLVFIAALIGLIVLLRRRDKNSNLFLSYFVLSLTLEVFSARTLNQRYLDCFLLFLVIPAAFSMWLLWKAGGWKKALAVVIPIPSLVLSLFLVISPISYILETSKVSPYAETGYVYEQTSGFGIQEVVNYLKGKSRTQVILVGFALNSGNPENAIDVYMAENPHAFSFHMASAFFPNLKKYQCLSSKYPVYFVSRYDQQAGLDGYLVQEKRFQHPYSNYWLSIYALKKNCKGNTLSLSDVYKNALLEERQIK